MIRPGRRLTFLLVILGAGLLVAGCGPDLSTPDSTVQYARQQVADEEWEQLYEVIHPERRQILEDRVRKLLVTARGMVPPEEREPVTQLMTKPPGEQFAVLMEGLATDPQYEAILQRYLDAGYEVEERGDSEALIRFESSEPLPFDRVILRVHEGEWLVDRYPIDRPGLLR